jgi:polyphosphate kinase 2
MASTMMATMTTTTTTMSRCFDARGGGLRQRRQRLLTVCRGSSNADADSGRKKKKKKSKGRRRKDDDDDDDGHSIRSSSDAGFDPTRPIASFEAMENHEKKLLRGIKKSILDAEYELMLDALQTELVVWQDYVKANGMKVVVIFEGRDAAGKGGCISRITEVLSARICKVVALAAPTEQERTQWYFQRYVQHLPSAGQIVIFDRSWYNRSGVERVMGFATEEQVKQFEQDVNIFERMLVDSGVKILKLWFDVSDAEQESRFMGRIQHSEKRWKLSPMDLYARSKWYDYAKARDLMFENTSDTVPWSVVPADDKRVARLNAIQHILACIDYKEVEKEPLSLPPRQEKPSDYTELDLARLDSQKVFVVPQVYTSEDLAVRNMDGRKWEDIARDVAKKAKKELSVSMDESMDDSWPK